MKQQLVLLIVLIISCSPIEQQELKVLQEIIGRDFKDCQTYNKLLPIKIHDIKEYTFYSIDRENKENNTKPEFAEKPPNINLRTYVSIGVFPFSMLIQNSQISQVQFKKLVKESNLKKDIVAEIKTKDTTKRSFKKIMGSKSIDKYQEFGYPILTDSTLIVYRNIYHGIKNSSDLGLLGNGTYFIYSRIDQKWVLINKITKWIS